MRRGFDRLHPHVQSDLAPLVDEPDGDRLVRLRQAAVFECERVAVGHAGLAQQSAGLDATGLDVTPVAGELFQLRRRRGPWRARHLDAGDLLHDGDPREVPRRLVAIERECQRATNALVVEGLAFLVHGHQRQAVPGALLHGDLRSERGDERIAVGRGETPELDVRAFPADGGHLGGVGVDEDGAIAVEVRAALVPVVGVLLADPVRALHVLDELEGPGAHHVRLVPADVPGQDVGLEDPVVGRGQADQERGLGPLEPKPHRVRVRRLDDFDGLVGPLAHGDDARGRRDDLVVAGLDVARGHDAAVVKAHALPQSERVRQPVRRDRPGLRQVRHRPGARPVGRVDAEQRVVVGRQRVDDAERALPVAVVRRRLRGHEEDQLAAGARLVLGEGGRPQRQDGERRGEQRGEEEPWAHGATPPARPCRADRSGSGSA